MRRALYTLGLVFMVVALGIVGIEAEQAQVHTLQQQNAEMNRELDTTRAQLDKLYHSTERNRSVLLARIAQLENVLRKAGLPIPPATSSGNPSSTREGAHTNGATPSPNPKPAHHPLPRPHKHKKKHHGHLACVVVLGKKVCTP